MKKGIWITLSAIAFVLIVSSIVIFAAKFPYQATEAWNEQEPYHVQESYTEWVNSKNCDYDYDCTCTHKSWFGLGACDSCECYRTRTVTKYRTVQRTREVTKKDTLFNMWTGKTRYWFRI